MELQSIYRTYRPQKWSDVVGQELIVRTLTNEIAHESLVHAYLFTGTRGVGKTTTARLLAKTVNCEKRKKGEHEPCNVCASCVAITDGRSLDVMEIDAASHTGVENVRENIIAASRVAPLERKMKVFVIDEVHMLSTPAFNALLKTLEEPSSNVLFILATTDSDKLPDTIISRCQRFDFRRVSAADMAKRLITIAKAEGVTVAPDVLSALVRHADGSLRDAESMLGQLVGLGKKKITMDEATLLLPRGDEPLAREFVTLLLQRDGVAALPLVEDFVERGGDAPVFLADCIRVVRALLQESVRAGALSSEDTAILLRRLVVASRDAVALDPPIMAVELLIAEYARPGTPQTPTRTNTETPKKETKKQENSAGGGSVFGGKEAKGQESIDPQKKEVSAPHQSSSQSALSLAEITDRWHHVLAAAKKYNHSLALILKVATPVSVTENVVTLGFRYSFHADRLEDRATKKTACRIFEEVFASPLDIRAAIVPVLSEPLSVPAVLPSGDGAAQTFLSDVLGTFGGRVVKKA